MSPLPLRIRELREAKGWSQEELANRADVTQSIISRLETGRTQRLDVPVLDRISRALGVSAPELIEQPHRGRR